MQKKSENEKLILVCLDGLSWNLLHKFCKEGILPNTAKLIRKGVSGDLQSIYPLISPIIWATIYTGKKPEKHAVKDFYINPKSIKTKQIWEILQKNGEKVGVFNAMTAFESNQSYAFFLPGFLTPIISTYPSNLGCNKQFSTKIRTRELGFIELLKYAFKFLRHGCKFSTLLNGFLTFLRVLFSSRSSETDVLYKIKEFESTLYHDVFMYCLKKYSPTFSIFFDEGIDFVSHYYWKYMQSESFPSVKESRLTKYKDVIRNFYKKTDEFLGRIISVMDEDTTLIIVSDHGFQKNPKSRIDCEINVNSLLSLLDLKEKIFAVKVFHGGIFRPKNGKTTLYEIENLFSKVKSADGDNLFNVTRTDPYVRITVNDAAIKDKNQKVIMPNDKHCLLKDVINISPEISGAHYIKGVIIMVGSKIKSGEHVKNASVFDVTPTILALKRVPIPNDVDGRVLTETFKEKINLEYSASNKTKKESTGLSKKRELTRSEENYIKERLKELGYL